MPRLKFLVHFIVALVVPVVSTFALPATASAASVTATPAPRIIVYGDARFTVITSTLVRLEFSRDGQFINDRTYFAWHRHIKPPQFQVRKQASKLVIKTARMELIWRGGNKGFTPHNLAIRFRNGKKTWTTWHPGDKQTGNLGGTRSSLDGCTGREPITNGVLSHSGWYLFRDSTPLLTDGKHPWIIVSRPSAEIADWYFFGYGQGHYHTALRDLTTISGRVPIPPRYMLGSWRSRYHSFTAKEFQQLVLEYNAHKIPLDVMVMDMGWHTSPHWGSYNWNRKFIPHPRKLLAWLHEQGLHVALNWHPQSGVGPWDSQFQAMCHAMGLNSATTKRVPFAPGSQKSMSNCYRLLLNPMERRGVDFWWLDWSWRDPYVGWVNALDFWNIGRPATGNRGASFSRWGGWGDQRYPVFFSGDTTSRWRVLRFEIPFTVTAGNVGADYWSNDIGGFGVYYIPSAQLYTRWIQFGALSPIFRTHNTGATGDHRVPWYYGHRTLSAAGGAYRLRSKLFPYIYSCAYACWKNSLPLVRPLYLSYPAADQAYQHQQEYTFGSSLLVDPIVSRGIGKAWLGATDMWFPHGTWWSVLSNANVQHSGDQPVLASGDEIPVFVRGGVPLPMQSLKLRMAAKSPNPLVVCVYPGSHGQFTLYEDDGTSPAYLHGAYALTALRYDNLGTKGVRVTVGATVGKYAGQPLNRKLIIRLPVTTVPIQVLANGKSVPQSATGIPGYSYNPATLTTDIRLPSRSIRRQTVVAVRFSGSPVVQALLPEVINRIALVHRALAGAGELRVGWKFTLDRVLFDLQTLRSVTAQVFGPASATSVNAGLAKADATLAQVQANLMQHHSVQARAAKFALSNMFLRAAIKLRDAGAGVLAHNQHRYYAEYSVYRRPGTRTYSGLTSIAHDQTGLMLQALIPASGGNGTLSVDVQGLAKRDFTLSNHGQANFVFLPIAPAIEYPLYYLRGKATLRIGTGNARVSASRRIHLSRQTLNQWSMVGPFAMGKAPELTGTRITPTILHKSFTGLNGQRVSWNSRTWESVRTRSWYSRKRWINVHQLYPIDETTKAAAIAVTWIKAYAAIQCQFNVRDNGGIALWINGQRVLNAPQGRDMAAPPFHIQVHLKEGWNEVMVQTYKVIWGWGFAVRPQVPAGIIFTQANHPPER